MASTYKICMVGCSAVGKSSLASQLVNKQFISDHQATPESDAYFHKLTVSGKDILLEIEDTKGFDTDDVYRQLAASTITDSKTDDNEDEEKAEASKDTELEGDEKNTEQNGKEEEKEGSDSESDSDEKQFSYDPEHFKKITTSETLILGEEKTRAGFLVVFDLTRKRTFEKAKAMLRTIYDRIEWDPSTPGCPLPIQIVGNKVDMKKERAISDEKLQALSAEFNQPYVEASARLNQNVEDAFISLLERVIDAEEERLVEVSRKATSFDPRKYCRYRRVWPDQFWLRT